MIGTVFRDYRIIIMHWVTSTSKETEVRAKLRLVIQTIGRQYSEVPQLVGGSINGRRLGLSEVNIVSG
jgi:hypothetical protein